MLRYQARRLGFSDPFWMAAASKRSDGACRPAG